METQGFSENSRPKQPSKLQKLKISETPLTNHAEKTPKKNPCLMRTKIHFSNLKKMSTLLFIDVGSLCSFPGNRFFGKETIIFYEVIPTNDGCQNPFEEEACLLYQLPALLYKILEHFRLCSIQQFNVAEHISTNDKCRNGTHSSYE